METQWITDQHSAITTDKILAQSEEPPFLERIIEAVILSIIAVVSIVGNIALWIVILRDKRLQSSSNASILALSGADLLVSSTNMPLTVYSLVHGTWGFSHDACIVTGFITMCTFIASVMFLAVISVNRYLLICKMHKFKTIYTKQNVTIMIIIAFVIITTCYIIYIYLRSYIV